MRVSSHDSPGRPFGNGRRLVKSGGQGCVFFGSLPIHVYDLVDRAGERAAIAMLARTRLASRIEIAVAFGVYRNTVGRLTGLFEDHGMSAVVPAKRGPKGPHKVTPEVHQVIAANPALPLDALRGLVAERTGIGLSRSHLHRVRWDCGASIKRGRHR